jgi:gamma-glutamylcyclotransferase (GGCT)/AIG2-like uncharacterized protein YtfP
MQKVFVYGTLQQPEVQQSVIGRIVTTKPAKLAGYAKDTIVINGASYPIAVPSDQASIDGLVLGIEDEELPKLDKYETDAYIRVKVRLESGQEAWTYCRPSI